MHEFRHAVVLRRLGGGVGLAVITSTHLEVSLSRRFPNKRPPFVRRVGRTRRSIPSLLQSELATLLPESLVAFGKICPELQNRIEFVNFALDRVRRRVQR